MGMMHFTLLETGGVVGNVGEYLMPLNIEKNGGKLGIGFEFLVMFFNFF